MRTPAQMLLLAAAMLFGDLAEAGDARPPHPEPRVIVDVLGVRGPHDRNGVERSARLGWGKIVRCYRASETHDRVVLTFELVVSGGGAVTRVRRTRSSNNDRELGACLAGVLKNVSMPKARSRSTAIVEMRLAPGDPPRPQPGSEEPEG